MSDLLDRRVRLAEAAQRYYIEGWSQDQVAAHLETSRSNVSRLLEMARQEGIVRFVVDHPLRRHTALEKALGTQYPDTVFMVSSENGLDAVGRLAAPLITEGPPARIAIGWGRTVQAVIDHVATSEPLDAEVVQIGGDMAMGPSESGHVLVARLARALGAAHRFLHAPAMVESSKLAAALLADPRIEEELDRARAADLALVGIGVPGAEFVGDDGAAVLAARLVDREGRAVNGSLAGRVIAISLEELRRIPRVVAVAAGEEKGGAIAAVLAGAYVDTMICDSEAARAVLGRDQR